MESLVNIIHPHTYKIVEKEEGAFTLVIGGTCKENEGRDKKVADFVSSALNYSKILCHNYYDANILNMGLRGMTIELDPVLNLLKDPRIRSFYTLSNGFPRSGKRPEDMDYSLWKIIRRGVISHSNLKSKLEGYSPLIFFGGAFERCLGNVAAYCADKYEIPGKDIFCVRDMSVLFNEQEAGLMEQELLNRDIQIINYEEALDLIN